MCIPNVCNYPAAFLKQLLLNSGKSADCTCPKWIPLPKSRLLLQTPSPLCLSALSPHVASLYLAQYKILLCCFFIKRIDLIPKLARHLHLPAHRLACVCSLTKDTYVFECIFPILSGICQCAGVCACGYSPRFSFPFAWLDLNAEISMLHTSRFHSVAGRPLLKDIWYALH